jgi:type I restriction enzyme M protein
MNAQELKQLEDDQYLKQNDKETTIEKKNKAQHTLRQAFAPFFDGLHQGLKQLDKIVRRHEKQLAEKAKKTGKRNTADKQIKELKTVLEALHAGVKSAESYYKHIHWLQARFPKAEYEDVISLNREARELEKIIHHNVLKLTEEE